MDFDPIFQTPLSCCLLNESLLIVDDEPLIARTTSMLLYRNGFSNVRVEGDSRNVVQSVHKYRANLVLLDIDMPHLNGLEVLEQLNNDASLEDVTVLMHSAAGERERGISFELGAAGFVAKPTSEYDLITAVKSVLSSTSP